MAPLWFTGITLALIVQVTVGVNPLDSIVSATLEKVLQGVEARLAQQGEAFNQLLMEQTAAMEAKTDALETRLMENKATMEARFAGQTEELEMRLAQHYRGMEVALESLKDTIINEIKKPATSPEGRPKEEHVTSNGSISGLLHDMEARLSNETLLLHRMMNETKSLVHGLEESVTSESRYITYTTETLLREARVHSTTTEALLRESLVHSNITASLLRESLDHANTTESLLRESLDHANTTESLLRETLVHSTTTESLMREGLDHYNQTISGLLLDLEETMVVESPNIAKTTDSQLKDSLSQPNDTVGALLHGMEASLTALCSSHDTHELVSAVYTSSKAQLQILMLLVSQVPVTFLRRVDGSVNFTRNWANYTSGFGDHSGNFWLGLEALHQLTTKHEYGLRVDMETWSRRTKWAKYQSFRVGSEAGNYTLTVTGYDPDSTTFGDSMAHHNGAAFSTYDKDNDRSGQNCAGQYKSGWWYNACLYANPTGQYQPARYWGRYGIRWHLAYNDRRSFKSMTLKLTVN